MPAGETRTKVTIFTGSYRVKGYIDLLPGARMTDFMAEAKPSSRSPTRRSTSWKWAGAS